MRMEGSQIRQSAPPLAHFEDENRVSKHQAGTYTNRLLTFFNWKANLGSTLSFLIFNETMSKQKCIPD